MDTYRNPYMPKITPEVARVAKIVMDKVAQGEDLLVLKKQFISVGNTEENWKLVMAVMKGEGKGVEFVLDEKATKWVLYAYFIIQSLEILFLSYYVVDKEIGGLSRNMGLLFYLLICMIARQIFAWVLIVKGSPGVSTMKIATFLVVDLACSLYLPLYGILVERLIFILAVLQMSFVYFLFYIVILFVADLLIEKGIVNFF